MSAELAGAAAAERIRDGFEVAILGAPNSGKSTLLNRLAGRDAAITSEIAGTTRDVIEVRMDLGGLPVTILDTAGLRETGDVVEAIGIERALSRARAADLRVVLTDGPLPVGVHLGADDLVLRPKADRAAGEGPAISGLTGEIRFNGPGSSVKFGRRCVASALRMRIAGGVWSAVPMYSNGNGTNTVTFNSAGAVGVGNYTGSGSAWGGFSASFDATRITTVRCSVTAETVTGAAYTCLELIDANVNA